MSALILSKLIKGRKLDDTAASKEKSGTEGYPLTANQSGHEISIDAKSESEENIQICIAGSTFV